MKVEMKSQDIEELYQLLKVYERTYGGRKSGELLEEISARYKREKGGIISTKRNPRGAGRKKQYKEAEKQKIRELRRSGMTIRRIAEKTGCSVGYVQGLLSDPQSQDVQ